MPTAPAIIDTLSAAGVTATLTPSGAISVAPASRLTEELRRLIRAGREDLRGWLQAANDPTSFDFFRPIKGSDFKSSPWDAPMSPGEVEAFTARVLLFMRRGLTASRAEALADKLKRREREGDDRRACIECQRLSAHRTCTAWRQAGLTGNRVDPLFAELQRCPAFAPAVLTPTEN
ncbi:MAG: hypothetical protein LBU72_04530 [Burkholderiaceae bacterium]|jgi:hypothetical protein|nr:hypothetical protein [Burkholderiaceae bacterium]